MKRCIIFAPHQDDEILACAGTIAMMKQINMDIFIVFATNGDFAGKEMSAVRLKESTKALEMLGIDPSHIIVLGFADTGMEKEVSFLWRLYHASSNLVIPSEVSNETYHPLGSNEYGMARWRKHSPYTRQDFLGTVKDILEVLKPVVLFTSSFMDAHGDHAALYYFVIDALKKCRFSIPVYQYLIHSGNDARWPERGTDYYKCPVNIPFTLWKKRSIVQVDSSINKLRLIHIFQSQLSSSGYLESFAKKEEFFIVS